MKIEQFLNLSLITYNRGGALEKTLSAIAHSNLKICHLTIYDNCSTDNTELIVEKLRPLLPNMIYVKNKLNIGIGANYLRALEKAEGLYHWILCDDDDLALTDLAGLEQILEREQPDFIYAGGAEQNLEIFRGNTFSTQELIQKDFLFFRNLSFIPSLLFQPSKLHRDVLFRAYKSEECLYPHFQILCDMISDNSNLHILQNSIVHKNFSEIGSNQLVYFCAWVNSVRSLPEPYLTRAQHELSAGAPSFSRWLINKCILSKPAINDFWKIFWRIVGGLNKTDRVFLLSCLPVLFIPNFILSKLIQVVFSFKKKQYNRNTFSQEFSSNDCFRS
jgi:glycosyltransferase involved in cell wall biosynthesis